jgi:hypothetical protein
MTDKTDRPGLTDQMAWTDETDRWARTGRLDPLGPPVRPAVPERQGRTAPMVWTDAMVDRDRAERRARLGMPDRPAPLVRRVNAARRVTRVIGAILARLVKRANL